MLDSFYKVQVLQLTQGKVDRGLQVTARCAEMLISPGQDAEWCLGRKPSRFTSGSWFWSPLLVHTHLEPALALVGSVAHQPPTQGDRLGVPIDQLLSNLRGGALQ